MAGFLFRYPKRLPRMVGSLVPLVLVWAPLVALGWRAIGDFVGDSGDVAGLIVPLGRQGWVLLRSLGWALGVSVFSTVLGVLGATWLWRIRHPVWRRLRWVVASGVLVPPYVHALAWFAVFEHAGISTQGWLASGWVAALAWLPATVALALIALESIDGDLLRTARIWAGDSVAFRRVALPLAVPMVLAGGAVVFVLALLDFSVPAVFQCHTYAMEIHAEFSQSYQPARALALSIPLVVMAVAGLWFARRGGRSVAHGGAGAPVWRHGVPWRWSAGWQAARFVAGGVFVASFAVPLVSLLRVVGSWRGLWTSVVAARGEMATSLWTSALSALVCAAVAVGFVRVWWEGGKGAGPLTILIAAPLAVPPSLIGVGLIVLWNRSVLHVVYGSPLVVVFACVARFAPVAVLILAAQARRVDSELLDVTRVAGVSWWRRLWSVDVPLLAPGVVAAFCAVFALSLAELGATLLVSPPGGATIAMRVFGYLHYGASSRVAGLCLAMALAAVVAGVVSVLAMARGDREAGDV